MRSALLVIDVQIDFCPGGALAVPDGDAVVPVCNAWMDRVDLVVLTQDWHPPGHRSFASVHGQPAFSVASLPYGEQVLWPDHCVQGSAGAAFHPDLRVDRARLVLRKGADPAVDSYSAFRENDRRTTTGLAAWLRAMDVDRVVVAGLATDFCVRYSVLDAAAAGLAVEVIDAGVRGIDPSGVADAWAAMTACGARRVR